MPSWKKIITSGSSPNFSQVTVDNTVTANAFSGIFQGALSSSAQIATQISGAFTTQSFSDGTATTISGSSVSTGSFGHILKGGVNWDTAVSTSAAAAGFSSGAGSSFTAAGISGSLGTNATLIRGLTASTISGSWQGQNFISSSGEIASNISGAFGNQRVGTTDDVTFASLTTTGDITARNYIVSSSVTYMTSSFSSGSTIFGDDSGDSHKFTGSLLVTGSFKVDSGNAEFAGNISGSVSSTGSFGHIMKSGVNWDTAVSKSAASAGFGVGGGSSFTAAGISGSWQSYTLVSSSAQIATQISGSLGTNASVIRGLTNARISGSLGANASVIRGLTNVRISGSFTTVSSSLASRIETAELELGNTLISGSAQIATQISGAFGNQRVGTTDNVVFNKITTTGPDVFGGNVTIAGNLTLQGSQSAAETLVIADQFGFFASGSEGAAVDAGLLVQSGSSAMTGSALYHDVDYNSTTNINGGRWAVAKNVKADDTDATANRKAFVTTVVTATDANDPDGTDVHYGVGEMYVNSDGEIWIYTGS